MLLLLLVEDLEPGVAGQHDLPGMDFAVGHLHESRHGIIALLIFAFGPGAKRIERRRFRLPAPGRREQAEPKAQPAGAGRTACGATSTSSSLLKDGWPAADTQGTAAVGTRIADPWYPVTSGIIVENECHQTGSANVMFRWGGMTRFRESPGRTPVPYTCERSEQTRSTRCLRQSTLMKVRFAAAVRQTVRGRLTGQRRGWPARGCWPCPGWEWPRRDRGRSTAALRPRQSRKAGRGASRFPPALTRHALAADREEAAARSPLPGRQDGAWGRFASSARAISEFSTATG